MKLPVFLPLLVLSIMLLSACRSEYAALQPSPNYKPDCIEQFRPQFSKQQYRANIDVTGKHLSGILFFKKMPSGNTRVLFTGEAGPTFFDLEIASDTFIVHYCMKKLQKKAVLHTLRRDFELMLMENTGAPGLQVLSDNMALFYPYHHRKETAYYVTDPACTRLLRAELAGKRKMKVRLSFAEYEKGMPKSVVIEHQTFNFVIRLDAITSQD